MAERIVISGGTQWQDPYRAVRPNPLRYYSSSTYNIKLGVMRPDIFNSFNRGDYTAMDQNILIASGGIPKEKRNIYFDVDFYIEDLEIESVIGLNEVTRAANATRINFKIVEPNGFTFFNRIYFVCRDLKIPNYLNVPYFLTIRFQGWDDIQDGHNMKAQSPPFIVPILITQVKSSVTVSGAEYQVEAVPYYDSGIHDNLGSIKSDIVVTASTVGEMFNGLAKAITEKNRVVYRDQIKGVQGANKELYNEVAFEIDPEIAETKLSEDNTISSAAGILGEDIKVQTLDLTSQGRPRILNLANQRRRVPNGSNIVDVVDHIIKTSRYITSQQVDEKLLTNLKNLSGSALDAEIKKIVENIKKPLMWYKIKPVVEIKDYDIVTNQYAKKVTYRIVKYSIYNGKDTNFKGWGESVPVKRYQYIFTGKNEDVLDFSIRFDNLYHLIVLANANKNQLIDGLSGALATTNSLDQESTPALPKGDQPDVPNKKSVWPIKTQTVAADVRRMPYTNDSSAKEQRASIFATNVVTGAAGDMIEITLDIIGDPEYLVGYNERDFIESNEQVKKTLDTSLDSKTAQQSGVSRGDLEKMPSLSSLDQEINCYINFRTPQDYDPETGLMLQKENSLYFDSAYDGVYKIITVRSTFNSGVFKQTLTCVRLPNQTADYRFSTELEQLSKQTDSRVVNATPTQTTAAIQDVTFGQTRRT